MARRSKIDIITDLLNEINKKGEMKPTHVLYKANLSHSQMKTYLDDLIDKEIIQKTKKGNYEYIIITDKGTDFLKKLNEMREFSKAFGL